MPGGGGGACFAGCALSASRASAGCGGVFCGDVPVFGMIVWIPIVTAHMDGFLNETDGIGRVSILCIANAPNAGAS
jgi:hypothetical protein